MTDALFPRAGTCRRAIPRLILPRPGLMARDDWQAHLHPRDETGKFTSGPGSHAESTPKHPAWMGKTGQAFYDEVVNGLGSKHHDEIAQALKDKAATLKAGDYSSYANKLLAHVEQAHGLEKGKLGKAKPMGKADAKPAAKEPPAPAPEPAKAPDVDAEFKSMVDEALATGSPQQHAEFLEGLIPHTEGAKKAYLEGQLADLKGKIAAGTAKGEATEAPLSAEKAQRKAEIEAAEEPAAPPPETAALPDPTTKVQKNIHDLMQSDLPAENKKQKIASIAEASQHPPNKAYAEQALALLDQQAGAAAPSMQDEAYEDASKTLASKGNIGFWLNLANSKGVDPDVAVGIKKAIEEWQDANPPDDEPAFFAPAEPEAPEPPAAMTPAQVDAAHPNVEAGLKSAWNEEIAKNKKGAIVDLEGMLKYPGNTPPAYIAWVKDKVAALKDEGTAPAPPAPMTSEQVDAAHPAVQETLKKSWNQSIAQDPAGSAATLQKYIQNGAGLSPKIVDWMKDKVAAINAAGYGTAAAAEPPAPPPEPPVSLPAPHPSSKGQTLVHGIAAGEGSKADKIDKIKAAVADDPHHFPAGGYAKKYADQLITALGGDPEAPAAAAAPAAAQKAAATAAKPAAAAPSDTYGHAPHHWTKVKKAIASFEGAKRYSGAGGAAQAKSVPTLNHAFWENTASADSRQAVWTYTGGTYHSINSFLRTPKGGEAAKYAQLSHQIDEAFEHEESRITEDIIVRRGEGNEGPDGKPRIDFPAMIKALNSGVPVTITKEGFISTSMASTEAFSGNDISYEICLRKGTKALGAYAISQHKAEQEILLRHGQPFEVLSVEKKGKQWVVRMVTPD
jgi:hypothetical protein